MRQDQNIGQTSGDYKIRDLFDDYIEDFVPYEHVFTLRSIMGENLGKIMIGFEPIPKSESDREKVKDIVKKGNESMLDSQGHVSIEEVKQEGPTLEEKLEMVKSLEFKSVVMCILSATFKENKELFGKQDPFITFEYN